MQTFNASHYFAQPVVALSRTVKILLLIVFASVASWYVGSPSSRSSDAQPIVKGSDAAKPAQVAPQEKRTGLEGVFHGQRSYGYLKAICDFGSRMSGSAGMKRQQEYLEKHFTELGAKVSYQRFKWKHPLTRRRVPMANLIVEWRPEAKRRILLCAHYDTRPRPDREINPRLVQRGVFLGANDGASGVALLMELGHHVALLPDSYGIDFVMFDGEELVYDDDRDPYFLGSTWFAHQYVKRPPSYQYTGGVLFDMVADAELNLYQEQHSATWPGSRLLVQEIWGTAQRLGVREFIPRVKYEIRDDHLPLNEIAKIPVCDVIDFEYPDPSNRYWHTTADAPGRCSGESLGKVGWVVLEWLAAKR